MVTTGQKQQTGVLQGKRLLHSAERTVKQRPFDVAGAVNAAVKEGIVIQSVQGGEKQAIARPRPQALHLRLIGSPIVSVQKSKQYTFFHVAHLLLRKVHSIPYYKPNLWKV